MASLGLVTVATALLLVQAALAQQCGSQASAAREEECSDEAFAPRSCRSALMDASTAYRAYVAAWMSAAAYDKADGVSWETAARRELARWRFSDIRFGVEGGIEFFVADAPDHVFVVFRGSDEKIDMQTNIQTDFIAVTGLGRLHKGFWKAFKEAHSAFEGYVSEFRAGRKGVIYAGHSLGAAIATIAAANRQYSRRDSVANVFTFGSPRVGDATWAESYQVLGLDELTYRYVTEGDPVPMLPPGGSVGYRHVGLQRRLFSSSPGDCRANTAALYCPKGSQPSVTGGFGDWVTDRACAGNGFVIGVVDFLAPIFTDISFSASDLLAAEPSVCCADISMHDLKVYLRRMLGSCLSACDRLVDCSCQQDAPEPAFAGAPAPAGDYLLRGMAVDDLAPGDVQGVAQQAVDDLTPGNVQGTAEQAVDDLTPGDVAADGRAPAQQPAPEPRRNPDTTFYRIIIQTSCAAFAGTNAYLEVKLNDAEGRWYRTGYLDNPGDDLARCQQDTYDLGTRQWVDPSTMKMQVYFKSAALLAGGWQPSRIQVIQNPGDRTRVSRSFCHGTSLDRAGWYRFSPC